MSDLFDLSGKRVLMTGSSRGIGRAMAAGFAAHGASVVISSRKEEACAQAAAEINAACGAERAHVIPCNASRKDEVEALVRETRKRLGSIDVLVGNAGVNPHFGPMQTLGDDAFDKIMNVNVKTNHWLAHLVAPDMAAAGGGAMIFTASIGAFKPSAEIGAYNISKLALIGLVRNLAMEYGRSGIRVNAVCPGLIKTEMARALYEDPKRAAAVEATTALGRLGETEDFQGIGVFLASKASAYVTGQALTVCGGSAMWS